MEEIFTNIKERVLQIPENKGLSKEVFFEKLGVSYGNFKGKSKKSALSADVLAEISTLFPDINLKWLLTGVGSMTTLEEGTSNVTSINSLKTDRKRDIQSIPLYTETATAGIIDLLSDNKQKHIPSDYISIPNLPKCDGAVPITGDSMYPLLKSGDLALYKEVHDFENIIWGEMYLIALSHKGDNFFFAKYVQKGKKTGWINLVSHNQNHQSKEFPIAAIKALALIKASVRINTQF